MEETPEGLAIAAATREAAREKKRRLQEQQQQEQQAAPQAKRAHRAAPTCNHDVAIPEGYDVEASGLDPKIHGTIQNPEWEGAMAKQYPFVLDPFQQVAIACLERRESVFVAAHTSAGKTVVAEYATALALRQGQRVVYTSPLKALSNQKFRELTEEFGDVGLMTGDVSINPNANCIVMTTEILRSMIYRGSELLREIAWVIFDEVHYMQDRERGVVWEETIIFMPRDAKMVFLSATLPNAYEFAQWVAYTHQTPCHVVYTDYRPTPLMHYAFPVGGAGLYLVVDERGNFREDNFEKLHASFGSGEEDGPGNNPKAAALKGDPQDRRRSGGGRGRGRSRGEEGGRGGGKKSGGGGGKDVGADLEKIVSLIKQRHLEPVIVFSFSRRECEQYAMKLGKLDFNTEEEKEAVEAVYNSALQCLSEEDRELPAVAHMLPLLRQGVGVHHSGLLPILKEVVEILFQEQLVKCLFSTETFAMGLNMPARTVVFTALQKWDGEEHRWMGSGEYIQMSGRAGRRGKDNRGTAIMMVDDKLDAPTCRAMIQGKPNPLLSSFKLTYYTLLNLMRRMEGTGASMEYVIAHSFSQFQHEKQLPQMESRLKALQSEASSITDVPDDAVLQYNSLKQQLEQAERVIQEAMLQPDRCMHYLRPGRLVRVKQEGRDWGYGVVVSCQRREGGGRGGGGGPPSAAANYIVDVLAVLKADSIHAGSAEPAGLAEEDAEVAVIPVPLPLLSSISTLRISIPQDLKASDSRRSVLATLRDLSRKHPHGLPEFHPQEDMDIQEESVAAAVATRARVQEDLKSNSIYKEEMAAAAAGKECANPLRRKAALLAEAEAIKRRMQQSELTTFREESRNRCAVLRKLGHVDEEGVVLLKGRAACELDTADELLATELMFNGTFNALDPHQLVALVSTLVPVEKSNEQIKLTEQLAGPLSQLQSTAKHIAEVSQECKLDVDAEEYMQSFRPSLMDVIYSWSKGSSFAEICGMTDLFEGSIVRATRRLDELMQQLERAAGVVGDTDLAAKFAASRETIRRDIMFAASLYI